MDIQIALTEAMKRDAVGLKGTSHYMRTYLYRRYILLRLLLIFIQFQSHFCARIHSEIFLFLKLRTVIILNVFMYEDTLVQSSL